MDELNLTFARKNGRFTLCVTIKGTTTRHYKTIEGLLDKPNYKLWDSRNQRFEGSSISTVRNNQILREIREKYEQLIARLHPSDGKELFRMEREMELVKSRPKPVSFSAKNRRKVASKPPKQRIVPAYNTGPKQTYDYDTPVPSPTRKMPFHMYVRWLIYQMRHEKNKKPSKNYQTYVNLLHKLEREGKILNTPLEEIDNSTFIKWGKWLLSQPNNGNFKDMMKKFKCVHNKAFEHELNDNVLRYRYSNDAPKKASIKRKTLSEEQYQQFVTMDLSSIEQSGPNPEYYKELYRDFCIFMYEMKIRPVDALKLHTDNLLTVRGKRYIHYIPEKKKNYNTDCDVFNEITPKAKEIINRYARQSSQGYIFPFAMNEYRWDFDDSESWNRWVNRKQATLQRINHFLKKLAKKLDFDPQNICNYTMRHTTFTHEINRNEKPLMVIAKEGGTGIDMLETHYYNYLNL